ncbi:hypothetical protein SAMN05421768_101118 [Chryseobacterium joostei]|uniref:Uncharacterized protein n=1 Tax=Chryseobacterium joostei TaxID=112234 RepID=A0A1N7HSR9_9FLAO|nr:hypothetical protein SAMN05421768_101118 [Chryseobacterium joostei]
MDLKFAISLLIISNTEFSNQFLSEQLKKKIPQNNISDIE